MKLHISTAKELYKFYRWRGDSPAEALWNILYFFYWIHDASSEELNAYITAVKEATKNEKA